MAASGSSTASILLNTSQRGLRSKALAVLLELAGDHPGVARRVGLGRIDGVQQQPRAREVPQELVTQAGAFGGAFDEARDVGEHEARFAGARHAEGGVERGERIVGDFRARSTPRG